MRRRLAVLVAVTTILTVSSPVNAGPPPVQRIGHTAAGDWAYVQQRLAAPMPIFIANRSTGDRWYDWTTDGCSAPLKGDTGWTYDFRRACWRHDFGYRNLKRMEQRWGTGRTWWNSTNRSAVDHRFLADMRAHCATRSFLLRGACYGWAYIYFATVRVLGGP